jgi:hypothetical protein
MWSAFVAAAGVSQWGPTQARPAVRPVQIPDGGILSATARSLFDGERYSGYETGATGTAFGITHRGHLLFIDSGRNISLNEQWTDVRTIQITAQDAEVHVMLHRSLPDGSRRSYLTSLDATLRKALIRRDEQEPLVELSIDAERERFAAEVEAWAATAPAVRAAHGLPAAQPGDDIEGVIARVAHEDASLDEAIAFLKSRHIFVAEAMNNAPPHVVRRVVLSALEKMKG